MYIVELFIKWLNKNRRGSSVNPNRILKESFKEPEDDALTCEHEFMPIDSTNTVLACRKCGFVIKQRKQENKE